MSLAKYFFIPWIRQGIGSRIDIIENTANQQRLKIPFGLKINQKESELIERDIELFGPGDVVGFDQNSILRTDPKNNIGDFEPNYFPLIEFWEEDFPWMVTPGREEGKQWQSWVCLIVLKNPKNLKDKNDDDGEFFEPLHYDDSRPTQYITVKNIKNSLPNLEYSWAWAHAHVTASDNDNIDSVKLKEIIETNPTNIVSRLMCPRRLEPGVLYTAFVVPTFESGRKAGLSQNINEVSLLDKAWDIVDDNEIELPYYYRWEFRTGLRGDFEYLVRLLEPRPLDSRVGKRDIDCSDPGFGLSVPENMKPLKLGLEGALKHLDSQFTEYPDGLKEQFEQILDIPETLTQADTDIPEDIYIVSPIYGRWHAGIKMIKDSGIAWLRQLNLDPRHRATANFGTEVIQEEQEDLMHEAWRQVGAVEEANQRLREAQMAIEINKKILNSKLLKLPQNMFIQLTAPLHSRMLSYENNEESRVTLKSYLDKSTLPAVVFDHGFRKVIRKRGIIRTRQQKVNDLGYGDLLDRMNNGEVQGAGPAPQANGSGSIGQISDELRPSWAKGWFWKILKVLPNLLLILFVLGWIVIFVLNSLGISISYTHPLLLSIKSVLILIAFIIHRKTRKGRIAEKIREKNLTSELVASANPPSDFQNAEEFRSFAMSLQTFLNQKPDIKYTPKPADLKLVYSYLINTLNPEKTISKKLISRIKLRNCVNENEIIDQIMAAPEFPQAMYEPLRDISQDYLLPGLEYIQQNTITLLETNRNFIESYMTGLNVEFASELLWREYPTDQRGTYFRQFWDVSEIIRPPFMDQQLHEQAIEENAEILDDIENEDEKQNKLNQFIEEKWKELLRDINPIHKWRKNSQLGQNKGDSVQSLEDNLVLLIRGDLLKKYPTAVIYAVKAKWNEDLTQDKREPDFSFLDLESEEIIDTEIPDENSDNKNIKVQFPIFKGTLKPDITFLGFNLTEDEVRGYTQRFGTDELGNTIENDPGWFFVIEERISESRFGLDAYLNGEAIPDPNTVSDWDDLSWKHFYHTDGDNIVCDLPESKYIDGVEPHNEISDGITWGDHSGNIAYITHQKPVRIAVHGDDMMPESNNQEE